MKYFKIISQALLFVCFLHTVNGQQTIAFTAPDVQYDKALMLYNGKQYLASQQLFTKVKRRTANEDVKSNCAYYIANAAIRLNQQGGDKLMEQFVANYPASTKINTAFLDVADYYFENGKYARARKWYAQVNYDALSKEAKEKFNFNNGYAYFNAKQYDKASVYFNRISTSKKYGSQAKYYLGFVAYQSDDYEQANEIFDQVEDKDQYKGELAYFKADLNFKLGKFNTAISEGKSQLKTANRKELSELNKIIGESYFNLKDYAQALPYLKQYRGKNGKWNNTDYYQLGYTYFKQNNYEKAIGEFNKIVDGRNAVAQNAYYHLADSYLKTGAKQQALNAFKNASEMDFDLKIMEDASLNYAKLSYEIGNAYQSAPEVILNHLKKYPNTPEKEFLNALLIDSYITSKNYKDALQQLEKNNRSAHKSIYQKVAFFRGVELFNEGKYEQAKTLFSKSVKYPVAPYFVARATYWSAEADYVQNNFENAIDGYLSYIALPEAPNTTEFTAVNYNLAYAYFSTKKYEEAAKYFEAYTAQNPTDKSRLNDAYLRLGDSYFITSKYWPALESYNKAIAATATSAGKDYATFQKSMSYGFVNRLPQKIEGLTQFVNQFPKSIYRDDALYELGNVYLGQNDNTKAINTYDKLIKLMPKSSYVSKSLLKKALIYDNQNKSEQALTVFKQVAQNYAGSAEALQAVGAAKLIYIDLGRVSEYGQWVSTLDYVAVEDVELDQAAYASAEQQYLQNNHNQSEKLFEQYLQQYPQGQHRLKAHFYLGQLAFAKAKFDAAIPHYEYVLTSEHSEFTEQAMARLSQVFLSKKDYNAAIPILQRLEQEADFPQNIVFAQTNLMKSYYEQNNNASAVAYAEKVINNGKIDTQVQIDAHVIIARAAIKDKKFDRAKTAYQEVSKSAVGALAAEALYYDAFFKNKAQAYKASNEKVQQLARDFNGQKEWGAKGLLLMANNFYGLKDAYQATYILESIISNFPDYPDVVARAKATLKTIKNEEAKTNSSVEKGSN